MKKLTLSLIVIISFAFYAFFVTSKAQNRPLNLAQVQTTLDVSAPTPIISNPTPLATTISVPTVKSVPAKVSSKFRNGSYTGSVVDVYYGNVQVQAIISGGKLSDVQFLQYPSDRSTSLRKSQNSMPILKSESIASQSAQVDAVSGATDTSRGFVQSLSNALAQAAN